MESFFRIYLKRSLKRHYRRTPRKSCRYLKMTVLEQISNPYLASITLGLLYGFTVCTSACLPYVASYIAGIKAGFRRGVAVTAVYNLGRIAAYAVIGSIAGLLRTLIDDAFLETYQTIFSVIFGFVVIFIGISIFFKKPPCNTCQPKTVEAKGGLEGFRQNFDVRAFFMGFSRGFVVSASCCFSLIRHNQLSN